MADIWLQGHNSWFLVGGCSLSESWACLNVFCSLSIASWPPTGILLGHLGPRPSLHSLTDPSSRKRRAALAPPLGQGVVFRPCSNMCGGMSLPWSRWSTADIFVLTETGLSSGSLLFQYFLSLPALGLARNGIIAAKAGGGLSFPHFLIYSNGIFHSGGLVSLICVAQVHIVLVDGTVE